MPNALMQEHFDRLAPFYNELRTTDHIPIEYIRKTLSGQSVGRCADVGCGSGRYSLLLLRAFPDMHLVCCDINQVMLDEANIYLREDKMSRYTLQLVDAETFTASDGEFDSIISFNAVHHFDPVAFLQHADNALNPGGQIFIYTRLRKQNKDTVWGRFFPVFIDKESRLFRADQIEGWQVHLYSLRLQHIETFSYRRTASLERLIELAENRFYSTFDFYTDQEFEAAIEVFRQRIISHFDDVSCVEWFDANVMIVLQSTR